MANLGDLIKFAIVVTSFGVACPLGLKLVQKNLAKMTVQEYKKGFISTQKLQRCLETGGKGC